MEKLTEQQIQKLQKAYLKYTGEKVSDEKIQEILERLVRLMISINY